MEFPTATLKGLPFHDAEKLKEKLKEMTYIVDVKQCNECGEPYRIAIYGDGTIEHPKSCRRCQSQITHSTPIS